MSEFAFKDLEGKEGCVGLAILSRSACGNTGCSMFGFSLRAAKVQSSTFELFRTNRRMTEWVLPTANTVGQFVRVQLQNKNFLHFAEVEVFGVYSAFKYVGRVGTVQCSADATLVVMPPVSTQRYVGCRYFSLVLQQLLTWFMLPPQNSVCWTTTTSVPSKQMLTTLPFCGNTTPTSGRSVSLVEALQKHWTGRVDSAGSFAIARSVNSTRLPSTIVGHLAVAARSHFHSDLLAIVWDSQCVWQFGNQWHLPYSDCTD